jgi:hypothetical protein
MNGLRMVWDTSGEGLMCRRVDAKERDHGQAFRRKAGSPIHCGGGAGADPSSLLQTVAPAAIKLRTTSRTGMIPAFGFMIGCDESVRARRHKAKSYLAFMAASSG